MRWLVMFCCDNKKNKMACYEGMIAGGIIVAASIFAIKIFKKIIYPKKKKYLSKFSTLYIHSVCISIV